MSENKEINDILGQLRASVDKSDEAAGKTKKDKNDKFDREIAAMIEKQLNSRETAAVTEKPSEASPLLSEEIDLSEFVTDDEIVESELVEEEPVEKEIVEEIIEDEHVEEELVEEELVEEEPVEAASVEQTEPVEEEAVIEEEIPPAVLEALQAAFAVDDSEYIEPVEQTEDADEIVPDEEIETVEETTAVEETEPAEEIDLIAEMKPIEESDSVEETEQHMEEKKCFEEIEPVEDSEPVEDIDFVDDKDLIEVMKPIDETEIFEELEPIDEIESAEEVLPIEEIEPIEEAAPVEENEPIEEAPPIEEAESVEEVAPAQEFEPVEQEAVEEEAPVVAVAPVEQENVEEVASVEEPAAPVEPLEPDPVPADAWAYRGEEYRDHSQDETIQAAYNKSRAAVLIKLIVSTLICGLVGFIENIGLFGFLLIRPFEPTENPGVFIWTVIGLTLAVALLCLKQLKNGAVSLFKFDPEPHAIALVSLVVSIIYDIVMLVVRPEQLMLYNFPTVLCLTLTLLYELLVICREKNSFDVVSSEAVRYSPRRESRHIEGRYNALHNPNGAGEHRRVYSMTACRFSEGYFRRTNEKKKGVYVLNFMLLPLLAVAFIELVISLMVDSGVGVALRTFAATVQIALPVPLMLALVVPHLCASFRLRRRGCAILGESAVDEFSRPKLLVFEDRTMFPADRIGTKGLKLYDGFELYDVLVKTGSLFAAIGGPLGELFEAENAKYHRIRDVSLTRVERGGVEAVLEGKTKILAGQIDFIEKYGIYPKRMPRDEQLAAEGVVSVIYIVIDSRPAARLYADYRTDEAFEKQISALCSSHDGAAICTSDPGIDENMISRKRSCGDYQLAVIRPGMIRDGEEQESFDSGIVSLGDPRRVVDAVNECHRIKKSRYISMMASLFVFLANIIVATVLVTMKLIPYVSSGLVVLYTVMLTLPVILLPGVSGGHKK